MRDSKNILHAKLGVSPMERQYGGGLDAAYMNRRRSSAFAAPDATSAFASPMSKDGLPTIYREQGGPLPITSVYGQGIPRIIYRENGGDLDFGLSAEDMAAAYEEAGIDTSGFAGPDKGSYDSVTGMPSVTTPQGTPPPTNDGMGEAGIPLNPLNNFMINLQIKNQKAAQEKQARNQQYIQDTTKAANMANTFLGIPAVSNAAMVALQSQTPNTPQRGGVEDPETSLSQDKVSSDKSVSDLTTTEFNSLVGTLSDKMNNSQASKFSSSISNNDKVSDVVGKANDVFFNSPATNNKGFPNDSLTSYNRKTGGGLPTIYRDVGGGVGDDYAAAAGEYADMVSDAMAGDYTGADFGDEGGSYQKQVEAALSGQAPSAPSTPIDLSGVETYGGPVYDKRGNIIEGGGTFDPDRPYDSGTGKQPWFPGNDPLGLYYRQGSIPINIPTTKEGALALAPWKNLVGEDALREVMARPEGIAKLQGALKEGKVNQEEFDRIAQETITLGLGAAGTGFKTYTDDEWYGENGLDPDAPRKDIEDKRDIIDKIKGLVTITGKLDKNKVQELNKALNLMGGAKFEPHSGLMRAVIEGIIPTPFKAFSNMMGTGEKSIGRITFPSGKTFEVGDKGSITADKGLPEVDYGNDPKKVKKPKPQKKKTEEEKKKKRYMKDYFASLGSKEGEGGLSDLKNYYETQALKYVYPDKSDEEINIMINKP